MKNVFLEKLSEVKEKFQIYGIRKFTISAYFEIKDRLRLLLKGSYSQMGEDLIIDKYLGNKKKGFYIDIGANDPNRYSNTKRFYDRNWSGLNIEPEPSSYNKLCRFRKRDINLNIGAGNINESKDFYVFIPSSLSTFSSMEKERYIKQGYHFVKKIKISVWKTEKIFEKYVREKIDFLSIDVEGWEKQVLEGNNWLKFRPKVICIESSKHVPPLGKIGTHTNYQILKKTGYKKIFENDINSIFVEITGNKN